MPEPKPILSLMVPTRERARSLKFGLDSMGLDRNNIEALVWIDDDDPQLEEYKKLFGENKHVKLFVKPRVGYMGFHTMLNFLASQASGVWLMLWNDDAYMESAEWYDKFLEYADLSKPKEEPVVYNIHLLGRAGRPLGNGFPIISIKYFKLLGHIAGSAICDAWVRGVAASTNIQREIYGIRPHHRKFGWDDAYLGDLVDNVSKSYWETSAKNKYFGATDRSTNQGVVDDIEKIQTWMQKNQDRSLRVGFIGLGKLGLPVALAIESKGKNVVAYDIDPKIKQYIDEKKIPYQEVGADERLQHTRIEMVRSAEEVVKKCDLVFCAVQTPHDPRFEGHKPLKDEPIDFDYSYLKKAVQDIVAAADKLDEKTTVVVISTCLPGTYENEIKPLLSPKINYVYNPFFIAMGTVISDFLKPEFVLIGNNKGDITPLTNFYKMILGEDKTFVTDIITAEGIKVLYNTYISSKIVFANLYGEMAHKLGMNADDIFGALSRGTDRIISTKYLKAGVGDGGGCHPRDNIALSHLAKINNLSFDLFESLMIAREKHMEWLGSLLEKEVTGSGLRGIILGKSFKPESNIQTGSPAILLANILKDKNFTFDHYEFDHPNPLPKAVYLISTNHQNYAELSFPEGSVVIDPFRLIPRQDGVTLISIGAQ